MVASACIASRCQRRTCHKARGAVPADEDVVSLPCFVELCPLCDVVAMAEDDEDDGATFDMAIEYTQPVLRRWSPMVEQMVEQSLTARSKNDETQASLAGNSRGDGSSDPEPNIATLTWLKISIEPDSTPALYHSMVSFSIEESVSAGESDPVFSCLMKFAAEEPESFQK